MFRSEIIKIHKRKENKNLGKRVNVTETRERERERDRQTDRQTERGD